MLIKAEERKQMETAESKKLIQIELNYERFKKRTVYLYLAELLSKGETDPLHIEKILMNEGYNDAFFVLMFSLRYK